MIAYSVESAVMRRASLDEKQMVLEIRIWDPGRGSSMRFVDMDVPPQKGARLSILGPYTEQKVAEAVAERATSKGEQVIHCSTHTRALVTLLVTKVQAPRIPPSGLSVRC